MNMSQGTTTPLGKLRTAWAFVDRKGKLNFHQEFKE
jgi:hypothetical protein